MSHFSAANNAYRAIVPQNSAPSRACVALPLSSGSLCAIEIQVAAPPSRCGLLDGSDLAKPPSEADKHDARNAPRALTWQENVRRVLHVQSHSEWAPASIGPYSQAIEWRGLLFMAGQIPLDPGSMKVWLTLPPHHHSMVTVLSYISVIRGTARVANLIESSQRCTRYCKGFGSGFSQHTST
jgi:enamine deaminase RidA (YjgF/YER057c/UK114 family)